MWISSGWSRTTLPSRMTATSLPDCLCLSNASRNGTFSSFGDLFTVFSENILAVISYPFIFHLSLLIPFHLFHQYIAQFQSFEKKMYPERSIRLQQEDKD
jgi:hypothetical protein